MKKSFVIASVIALSSLTAAPLAIAGVPTTLIVVCPVASGDSAHQLRNIGSISIKGHGAETITTDGGTPVLSYDDLFTGPAPTGTPGSLANYSASSISFNNDAQNPAVTCNYTSSHTGDPTLAVTYVFENATGITEDSSTANSMTFSMPVGKA